ncbi:MAG: DUF1700 domain-containing protein [Christensenellaceae bacterium]|nr:DUF1700 domain-containing protein [Christensenellaceae bacterium]
MTRNDWLAALRARLSALPAEEQESALRYYEELFDEAGSEGEALAHLGDPARHAERILQESGVVAAPAAQAFGEKPKKEPFYRSVWFWLCVIFTLPFTLPLALGLGGAAIGVGCALIGAVVAILAVIASALIGGLVLCAAAFFFLPGSPFAFLAMFGGGLVLSGLGALGSLGIGAIFAAIGKSAKANRAKKAERARQAQTGPEGPKEGSENA